MLANDTNSSYQAPTTLPHLYWSLQTSLAILLDILLMVSCPADYICKHSPLWTSDMPGCPNDRAPWVPSSAQQSAWSCCCWLLLLPSDSLLLSRLARSPFIQRVFMLLYRGCSLICDCVPRMEIRDQAVTTNTTPAFCRPALLSSCTFYAERAPAQALQNVGRE